MKVLTTQEAVEYSLLKIYQSHERLVFAQEAQLYRCTIYLSSHDITGSLEFFVHRLLRLLPKGDDKILWMSYWNTFPEQYPLIEALRYAQGANKPLVEMPAHVFEDNNLHDMALCGGFALLTILFQWHGYMLCRGFDDHIVFGDENLSFYTNDSARLKQALDLAASFSLETT